ncbi:VOC family protein [Paenarthrobacter sp. Z7-10]|nr:VOC family protein [Paenarthrobacter sp. Z7-10]
MLHHLEIWVPDYAQAKESLGWMLEQLGYVLRDEWGTGPAGGSWQGGAEYIVLESGPDVRPGGHDRLRPGLNHLAFRAGSEENVERLARTAAAHGWSLLFGDRHPFAGGAGNYAAYLENREGFEVELVAASGQPDQGLPEF